MASAESPASSPVPIASAAPLVSEEDAARAVRKRHEALAAVRSKALKGKGAWYWTHLEPIVYHHPATGLPKAVKLRCSLCSAEFSASNPSRTASEHLKRGTCPNFTSSAPPSAIAAAQSCSSPRPVSSLPPSSAHYPHRARKRSPLPPDRGGGGGYPLAIVDYNPSGHRQPEALVLSGGKDDLEALAALESSVKRLKSPGASPCVTLTRDQADLAMTHLADWVYECCGAVSLASLDHPRLRAFLRHLGLPVLSRADLLGARLISRYDEALRESDARTRDAPFFQLASDGWGGGGIVSVVLNLPNGTSVFRRAVFVDDAKAPPGFAEDVLRDTIAGACAGDLSRCAGIVTSKFKLQALRELERRSHWMVNLPCQLRAVTALLKDFVRDLPLLRSVLAQCRTIAHFFSTHPRSGISLASSISSSSSSSPVANGRSHTTDTAATLVALMDDTMSSARELHRLALEDPESLPAEIAKTVLDAAFWNELGAALSLVRIAREAARDIEAERPFVGHCLPLWDDLRSKIRSCCAKHEVPWGPIEEVLERRFRKNYHPAWSAAFVLDPLYLTKDSADGNYLPPFRRLTPEQAADVDVVVSRLVSPEETHIALMELMKWRSQGLERDYALAVQIKQRDPATGRMRVANPLGSRIVWETHLREFRLLGRVAVRLIFLHATACGFKWNASFLRWISGRRRSRRRLDRAQKMAFLAASEKLKRGDLSSEEEKDAKLFCDRDYDDDDDDMSEEEEFMENAAL